MYPLGVDSCVRRKENLRRKRTGLPDHTRDSRRARQGKPQCAGAGAPCEDQVQEFKTRCSYRALYSHSEYLAYTDRDLSSKHLRSLPASTGASIAHVYSSHHFQQYICGAQQPVLKACFWCLALEGKGFSFSLVGSRITNKCLY